MTNKMPVVGQRYRGCNKKEFEVVFIFEANKQCVVYSESTGLWVQYIPTFFDYFEELPASNSQKPEEEPKLSIYCSQCGKDFKTLSSKYEVSGSFISAEKSCECKPNYVASNYIREEPNSQEKEEISEIERVLEESKRILRERYSNPEYGQELLADTLKNLVIAVEAGKIESRRGIAEYTPSDFMKHMERCEDALKNMPKPAVTFQTPDQPELGFNSPTWSDVSKQEPKIDMKEECVEPVSIWKDVSKLPEEMQGQVLVAMKDGAKGLTYYTSSTGDFSVFLRHKYGNTFDNISVVKENIERWAYLTDFINQVEDMEARLRKLEGK